MKNSIFFLTILCMMVFASCTKKVTLVYDESAQGSILSTDMSQSPVENAKTYLATAGTDYSKIRIYNESGGTCACTISGGNCLCKVPNNKGGESCSDSNTKCTRNKVIKIKVDPGTESKYNDIGFK